MGGLEGSWHAFGLASGAIAATAVGVLASAEHAAIGYQDALATVQVSAHLTAAATAAMGQAIESTALGTTASATDMAQALGPVAGELARIQGGALDAASANQVLAASQDLVESSGASLVGATKTITDLMLVYHENASQAAQISTNLFQAHTVLGIGVQQLGMMLQRLQPRIAGSGVDMQHLLGIVTQMAPSVGSGQRAMMMVGGVLQMLQTPSVAASKALNALHISLLDSTGSFIGFEPAVEKIRQAMVNMHDPIARNSLMLSIFGRAYANIGAQLVAGGARGIEQATAALDKQGSAADAAALKSQDAAHQMEMIPKTWETITTAIGMVILPALNRILLAITPVIKMVGDWVVQNPQLATTIIAVGGALGALGAAAVFIGPILTGIGTIMFGWVIPLALVAAGVYAFITRMASMGSVLGPLQGFLLQMHYAIWQVSRVLGPFINELFGFLSGKVSFGEFINSFNALIAGIGTAGSTVMSALGKLGQQVLGWIGQMMPSILADLGVLGTQIWNTIVAAVPQVVNGLMSVGETIVGWLQDQAATWAPVLSSWIGALTGWLQQAIPFLLRNLVDFGGQIINWIVAMAPTVAAQMQVWGGAIVNWIVNNGVPMVLGAFNTLVDSVVNLIGDGSTVAKIADTLGQWTVQFIDWGAKAAVMAAAALVGAIGYELIQNGPKLLGAVATLATNIIGGLVAGILNNPGALVEGIGLLLAGGAVISIVRWAASKVMLEYTGAMQVLQALGDVFSVAWSSLTDVIAANIGEAAVQHGIIYTVGMKVVDLLKGVFIKAWGAIGLNPEILAAAFGAGAAEGAAQVAGIESVDAGARLAALGFGDAAIAAAPAVGEEVGGGLIAGITSAIGTVTGAVSGAGGAIAASLVGGILGGLALGAGAIALAIGGLMLLGGTVLKGQPGPSGTGDNTYGGGSIGTVQTRNPAWWAKQQSAIASAASGTYGNLAGITPAQQQASLNDFRAGERASLASGWTSGIVAEINGSRDKAVAIAKQTPADIANAIRAGQDAVTSGAQALADAMKTPLTAARQQMILQAELNGGSFSKAQTAALLAGLSGDQRKIVQAAIDQGRTTGQHLAAGLTSQDASVRAQAMALHDAITSQLGNLSAAAHQWGYNTGAAYANGLGGTAGLIANAARTSLKEAVKILKASSPPGPESPLHEIDVWAKRTGNAYVEGMLHSLNGLPAALETPLDKTAKAFLTGHDTALRGIRLASRGGHGHPAIYDPISTSHAAAAKATHSTLTGAASHPKTQPRVTVHATVHSTVQVDKTVLGRTVSRAIADEERWYAGAPQAGSAF